MRRYGSRLPSEYDYQKQSLAEDLLSWSLVEGEVTLKRACSCDILAAMENIYIYLAQFLRAVKQAYWPQSRINAVLDDSRRSDYEHALEVLVEAMAELDEEAKVTISY